MAQGTQRRRRAPPRRGMPRPCSSGSRDVLSETWPPRASGWAPGTARLLGSLSEAGGAPHPFAMTALGHLDLEVCSPCAPQEGCPVPECAPSLHQEGQSSRFCRPGLQSLQSTPAACDLLLCTPSGSPNHTLKIVFTRHLRVLHLKC